MLAVHQESPKISVVIPAYNAQPWISDCLGSLVAQPMRDWEALVVDDCSTDETLNTIEEMAREDERIRVFHHDENKGPSCAINLGLDNIKGKYVLILGSDDLFADNAFEKIVCACEADDLDILRFSAENFADRDGFEEDIKLANWYCKMPLKDSGLLTGIELLSFENELRGRVPAHPVQICYKRDLIDSLGIRYIPGIIYEDNAWTYDLILAAKRARMVDDAFYLRRIHTGSLTMSSKRDVLLDFHSWFTVLQYMRNLAKVYQEDRRLDAFFGTKLKEIHASCLTAYSTALENGVEIPLSGYEASDLMDFELMFGFNKDRILNSISNDRLLAEASERIDSFEKSKSFKIGRAITAVPRLLRRVVSRRA